jgi:hypothetical protein
MTSGTSEDFAWHVVRNMVSCTPAGAPPAPIVSPAALLTADAGDDVALLAACREMARTRERVDYLSAHADDVEFARACEARDEAMNAVTEEPARTSAGLRAKARCVRDVLKACDGDVSSSLGALTESLLADILGGA